VEEADGEPGARARQPEELEVDGEEAVVGGHVAAGGVQAEGDDASGKALDVCGREQGEEQPDEQRREEELRRAARARRGRGGVEHRGGLESGGGRDREPSGAGA
jgi:hypothetical protein